MGLEVLSNVQIDHACFPCFHSNPSTISTVNPMMFIFLFGPDSRISAVLMFLEMECKNCIQLI